MRQSLNQDQAKYLVAKSNLVRNTPDSSLTTSALLALESFQRYKTLEGELALRRDIAFFPLRNFFIPKLSNDAITAISPDGQYFAYADNDAQVIRIFNTEDNYEAAVLVLESDVMWLNYSYQGSYLISVSNTSTVIHIWDAENHQSLKCLTLASPISTFWDASNKYSHSITLSQKRVFRFLCKPLIFRF